MTGTAKHASSALPRIGYFWWLNEARTTGTGDTQPATATLDDLVQDNRAHDPETLPVPTAKIGLDTDLHGALVAAFAESAPPIRIPHAGVAVSA